MNEKWNRFLGQVFVFVVLLALVLSLFSVSVTEPRPDDEVEQRETKALDKLVSEEFPPDKREAEHYVDGGDILLLFPMIWMLVSLRNLPGDVDWRMGLFGAGVCFLLSAAMIWSFRFASTLLAMCVFFVVRACLLRRRRWSLNYIRMILHGLMASAFLMVCWLSAIVFCQPVTFFMYFVAFGYCLIVFVWFCSGLRKELREGPG